MAVRIARIYDKPSGNGYRVLVDRLWPRGISKDEAHVDEWLKDVGPSDELRTWFGHDPERFEEFARRYRAELQDNPAAKQLRALAREHDDLLLLYGAKDTEHNQAVVLAALLGG